MDISEFHKNYREMDRRCTEEMHHPVKLHIEGGQVLWDRYVEDLMDWLEAEEARGHLELERVSCDETNRGFTFEAVSKDGTRWKSAPVDCHRFRSGDVVGRFPDKSGRLVLATRR